MDRPTLYSGPPGKLLVLQMASPPLVVSTASCVTGVKGAILPPGGQPGTGAEVFTCGVKSPVHFKYHGYCQYRYIATPLIYIFGTQNRWTDREFVNVD